MGKLLRVRSSAYLNTVRRQPCLVCLQPGEAHHLQRAQPRALGKKTGDQWAVPLCHQCHMKLHAFGDESLWWALQGVDPLEWAERSWNGWSE